MRLCLIFVLFFLLVLTISNALGLTGNLAQESYQGVIQNLRGGVNTFGFQPNIGQVGRVDVFYVVEGEKLISYDVKGLTKGKLVIDPPLLFLDNMHLHQDPASESWMTKYIQLQIHYQRHL